LTSTMPGTARKFMNLIWKWWKKRDFWISGREIFRQVSIWGYKLLLNMCVWITVMILKTCAQTKLSCIVVGFTKPHVTMGNREC
jgi:hypothetical protein